MVTPSSARQRIKLAGSLLDRIQLGAPLTSLSPSMGNKAPIGGVEWFAKGEVLAQLTKQSTFEVGRETGQGSAQSSGWFYLE